MWKIEITDDYKRSHKWFEKKRPRELKAVLDNLDTFHKALTDGLMPQQIKMGCIHPEPHGVLAIDQKGGGKSLSQTRLYIYPDIDTKILHIITLGDKGSQQKDIGLCNDFVARLRSETQKYEQEKKF